MPRIQSWQEKRWKRVVVYAAISLSGIALFCLWFAHLSLHIAILIILGTVPPEWWWLAQFIVDVSIIYPPFIAAVHDAGIFLSFFAFVLMFVWLVVRHGEEGPSFDWKEASFWDKFKWFAINSDAYFILAFLFIAFSWIGVWVLIHQAFLFYLESSPLGQGTLTDPTWPLLRIQPLTMVLLGTCLVIGAFIVLITLIIQHRPGVKREIPRPLFWVKVRERIDDLRYIEEDWRFYVIAFIPFFLAAFAVWIFAFEGLFARIFSIDAIIWAWLPMYPWTALRYHWLGIVLLGISFGWLIVHIVAIERSPVRRRKIPILKGVDRWRNWLRNPVALVVLGLLMIVLLFIGAIQMMLAFNASDYFPHWWGRTFVFSALIVGFVLIVSERGFDREKVDARSKKRLSHYKEYIPEDVIEQKVRYFRTLSPVEREKRIQETIQRYVLAEKREPPT